MTIQPTLYTVVEMLKSLQLDSGEIKTRVAHIESELAEVKSEQARQAKQLDGMAMDKHSFASDLYQL